MECLSERNSNAAPFEDELEPHTGVDAPLTLRYDTRRSWETLKRSLGVSETGAAIVMDLYAEAGSAGRWTSYSRRRNTYAARMADKPKWQKRSALGTYERMIPQVGLLECDGWIDNHIAAKGDYGWQSKMRATPALIETVRGLIDQGMPLDVLRPGSTLVLRNADKIEIGFTETSRTRLMRRNAEILNEGFAGMRLEGAFPACAVRIYHQSLERGGRFYLEGGSIQCMNEQQRLRVRIGGEATAEVDYKTLHPILLYNRVGIQPPADVYGVDGYPRDLVKVAMLALLNAPTWASAMISIACKKEIRQASAIPKSDEAKKIAASLIADLKRLHAPIRKFFHSGVGAYCMRQESDLMETVMLDMLDRGDSVIPIHDSALCRASVAVTLEGAMMDAAERAGLKWMRLETEYGDI